MQPLPKALELFPSVVYLIQPTWPAGSPIKIGRSQCLERRLMTLQTLCAHPLKLLGFLPGGKEEEGSLHLRFAHLRLHGEWFRAAPDLIYFIRDETIQPGRPWPPNLLANLGEKLQGQKG